MEDPNSKTADLDLYTIPSRSSWFSWADIHDTERRHFTEFFDGTSITRTPKIYKEYRDFFISKYRECPSRRLTFTEARKSLVGDVSVLRKVFMFLDEHGLINFGTEGGRREREEREGKWRVKVEEGSLTGVRVVASQNGKMGVLTVPASERVGEREKDIGLPPPLASYSDNYGDTMGFFCKACKQLSDSACYQCVKDGAFKVCDKCFKNGNYGKSYSVDDFKLVGGSSISDNYNSVWTEAETLLLIESVKEHEDDWELIAKNVKTKNEVDCRLKLIQLPLGEFMLGLASGNGMSPKNDSSRNSEQLPSSKPHPPENKVVVNQCPNVENENKESEKAEIESESKQNGSTEIESKHNDIAETECKQNGSAETGSEHNENTENQVLSLKRKRTTPLVDTDSSLMKQVALLASVVDPRITASAAEAAISALCDEIQCPREVFDGNDNEDEELVSSPQENKAPHVDGMDIDRRPIASETQGTSSEKNALPFSLQMKAATATALGAAAARAKLLADQEDREIETLVASMIETQMKKVQHKSKHFDDLELIMEKEYNELHDLKEAIIVERMNVLQKALKEGKSGPNNQPPTK